MLEEFLHRSGDMHSLCAKLVFREELKDVPIEKIAEVRPDLRKKVKSIEFSQQFEKIVSNLSSVMGIANRVNCWKPGMVISS